jgi:hypothetical protein
LFFSNKIPRNLKIRVLKYTAIGFLLHVLSVANVFSQTVTPPSDANTVTNSVTAYSATGTLVNITASATVSGNTGVNLAIGKTATASSESSASFPANAVLDGNTGTRWSSAASDAQWIYIDLGTTYNINAVNLIWGTTYGKSYKIQVSNNTTTWTDAYSTTIGDGATDNITPAAASTGRYVRMLASLRGGGTAGYSLFEFQIYGSPLVSYSLSTTQSDYFTINSATGDVSLNTPSVPPGLYIVGITATSGTVSSTEFSTTVTVLPAATAAGSYAFKKQLTLKNSTLGITNNQTNFPVLVYVKDNGLIIKNKCNDQVRYPNGDFNGSPGTNYDFAFVDPSSTAELNYQVESYDQTNGILLVWVKLPTLYAATNNTLSFYFGSLSPAHSAAFYSNTWTSDYLAVYHFNENPTSTVLDATNNDVDGTPTNITTGDDKIHLAAGLTGGAYGFNGTSKIISNKTADITGAFTLSAWVYVTNPAGDNKIVSNELDYGPGYKLGVKANVVETETRSTNLITKVGNLGDGGTVTSDWHYVQGVFDGTTFKNYVDGVPVTTTITKTAPSIAPLAGNVVTMGLDHRSTTDENFYKGLMDEVRISNVIKSDDWIKAEFINQTTPATFTDNSAVVTVTLAIAASIPGALTYTYKAATANYTDATNWDNTTAAITNQAPAFNGTATWIIPTGKSLILNSNTAVYGITLNGTATVNLSGNVLSVGCNIYNNNNTTGGILYNTNPSSQITWNGTVANQSYIGITTAVPAQVGNMTINNTATNGLVKITGGAINLYNTLTLTNGSLFVDNTNSGALTLKSSATATARVAPITSTARTITGNVTVERWFTGGNIANRGWRLMGSPVNNTSTIPASASAMYNFTSLKTNLNITGSGTNFDASASNGATILFYNTATKLFTWPSDPTTTNRNIGSGFYFYFRGSRTGADKLTRVGGVYATPEPNVVGLQTGVLNQHSFTYTLSNANSGFNQVGNPYPSSILMPSGSANTTLVGTTNMVYTYVSNANSITPQTTAVTIASGQGFFVKSNSATSSINFTEALKTANQPTAPNLLLGTPTGTEVPIISLKLVQDSANYDLAHLRYLDTYKNEYDEMEDADDLNGPGQNVFFGAMTSDNHLVAIASQPLGQQKSSVFLSVNDNYSGTYSIEKINLAGIPDVYDIWLMDHFKNDSLDLRANSVYNFNLDKANPQTFGNSRFEVLIRKKALPPYKLISFKGQRTGTDVLLKWNTENEYDYTSFELQKSTDGTTFEAVKNMRSSSQGSYSFKDIYNTGSTANVYYRLKQTDINDAVTYSTILIVPTQGEGTFNIFPNPATNVIQYRLKEDVKGSVHLRIINAMGIIAKSGTFSTSTGQQDISSLMPGSYTIELTDSNSKKIVLTGKFIKL